MAAGLLRDYIILHGHAGGFPRHAAAGEKKDESAEQLLAAVRDNDRMPELVLLDIYMRGKSGLEAAKELRSINDRLSIIFLTTSREYALAAYELDAAQYLVKPVSEEKLYTVMDRLMEAIEKEAQRHILLRSEGKILRVALEDIVCCEAQGKTQAVYLSDGTSIRLHTTMTALFDQLSAFPEFVKAGVAYIINLRHLQQLNAREMKMDSGRIIYLPRGAYGRLREQYFDYYCGDSG